MDGEGRPENIKRWHTAISPQGQRIGLNFSPYRAGIVEFRLWLDLQPLPPNNNGHNWYIEDLQALQAQKNPVKTAQIKTAAVKVEFRDKLRVICHSLRMKTFDSLDPFALADLHSRIRKLPSAEKISIMADNELEGLRKRLDRLLFDIDRRDNPRSKARADRYQADTHLPPRREPLVANWYGSLKSSNNS